MDPTWFLVGVTVAVQGTAAVWTVATVKAECRQANEKADRAHKRIDDMTGLQGAHHAKP